MREQLDLVINSLRGIWRYRWYGAAAAWVLAISGTFLVLQMPDQYRSSAQVHVDTESMLKPLMRGLVIESNVDRRVQLMTLTLFSRPNLERIARETDLDLRGSADEFDAIVDRLGRSLRLSDAGENQLYRVTYQGDDPQVARDVVQAAINLLVEESMGRSRQDGDSATRFLDRKIAEYEELIQAAERDRLAFRREHAEVIGSSDGDYFARLRQRQGEVQEARMQLEILESRKAELERQMAGETPVFGVMGEAPTGVAGGGSPESGPRIQGLQERLDELQLRYTDQHPRVQTLRAQIERIEQDRAERRAEQLAEADDNAVAPSAAPMERNPVYQAIRRDLSSLRGEAESLRTRIAQRQSQVEALQRKVDVLPELEAELQRFVRDQDALERSHAEFVERRKTAEISGEMERSSDQVEFRIVEPPRINPEPVAPNRPVLLTASFGGAVAGYGGVGILLALLWPTFHARTTLQNAVQLPVLGAVQRVPTGRTRWLRGFEQGTHLLVVGALVAAYALVMLVAMGPESGLSGWLPGSQIQALAASVATWLT